MSSSPRLTVAININIVDFRSEANASGVIINGNKYVDVGAGGLIMLCICAPYRVLVEVRILSCCNRQTISLKGSVELKCGNL